MEKNIHKTRIEKLCIDLDTTQRSIKITKQELRELKDNLFISLVLIVDK
ncbi:hypothetical protein [Tenacibaculum maritimum]|nr:hypothetical protein [Tenacibaculum maritimum]MCD9577785.1 hypothetical protein [Tenacibaculum maritimum]MCD9597359.1 hypothetical protein [Tenacibaculum maritimum]